MDQNRFLLRMPANTKSAIAALAKKQGLSMNETFNQCIQAGLQNLNFDLIDKVQKILKAYANHPLETILLFGSRARGTATPNSDVDLLLVFSEGHPIRRSLYSLFPEPEVSIHCVSIPKATDPIPSFWLEIALDGRILWQNENRVSNVLAEAKRMITSGKYVRKITHGQPYWVTNK